MAPGMVTGRIACYDWGGELLIGRFNRCAFWEVRLKSIK
jgi:hypothetical protein